jgi:hypothetical protein
MIKTLLTPCLMTLTLTCATAWALPSQRVLLNGQRHTVVPEAVYTVSFDYVEMLSDGTVPLDPSARSHGYTIYGSRSQAFAQAGEAESAKQYFQSKGYLWAMEPDHFEIYFAIHRPDRWDVAAPYWPHPTGTVSVPYAWNGGATVTGDFADQMVMMDPFLTTGTRILNRTQFTLDVVGLFPRAGEFADGVNALISLGRGDYAGAGLSAAAMIPFAGWGATGGKFVLKYGDEVLAAENTTTVIGRVKDLQKLEPGEKSLLDRLPDLGNPKANWKQNSGVLREEMKLGRPIRDASPGDTGGQFLNAERNLLRDRGWTFDPKTNLWMPPKG